MFYSYLSLCLSCLCFILLIYFKTKKEKSISTDEFLVVAKILESIVDNYKIAIFDYKIKQLQSQYDINPNSQVNSIKIYKEEVNKLVASSTKDIINNYFSSDLRKILYKYYNATSLSMIILNIFRG